MNIGTFQNHVYAVHDLKNASSVSLTNGSSADSTTELTMHNSDDFPTESNDCITDVDNDVSENDECSMPDSHKLLQKSSALFLLGLKEKYKLPQVVVQGIIDGVTSLTHQRMEIVKSQVF